MSSKKFKSDNFWKTFDKSLWKFEIVKKCLHADDFFSARKKSFSFFCGLISIFSFHLNFFFFCGKRPCRSSIFHDAYWKKRVSEREKIRRNKYQFFTIWFFGRLSMDVDDEKVCRTLAVCLMICWKVENLNILRQENSCPVVSVLSCAGGFLLSHSLTYSSPSAGWRLCTSFCCS